MIKFYIWNLTTDKGLTNFVSKCLNQGWTSHFLPFIVIWAFVYLKSLIVFLGCHLWFIFSLTLLQCIIRLLMAMLPQVTLWNSLHVRTQEHTYDILNSLIWRQFTRFWNRQYLRDICNGLTHSWHLRTNVCPELLMKDWHSYNESGWRQASVLQYHGHSGFYMIACSLEISIWMNLTKHVKNQVTFHPKIKKYFIWQ